MKIKLLATVLLLNAALLFGQGVSFITVSDEAQYEAAEDFTNTFEINLLTEGSTVPSKCQAVRLHKDWYITAAHCFFPMCDDKCDIQVRLVVTPYYEMDMAILHTTAKPRVFKNSKAEFTQKTAAYDIALLHMPAKSARHIFKSPAHNTFITEERFLRLIPDYNIYYKAVNGTNLPQALIVGGTKVRMLGRKVSVVSIWDGKRSVLPATKPVFYSPKKKYMFAENFGVIRGISGSGVMTNTGELVGLVSAIGTISVREEGGKEQAINMLFISSFDNSVADFIKQKVPGVAFKAAAESAFLKPVPAKYKTMAEGLDNM